MSEILLLANLMASCLIAFVMYQGKRMTMADPVFWYSIFHFLVFVFRPFWVVLDNYDFVYNYIGFYPDFDDHLFTLSISLLGYFSFCFGALIVSFTFRRVIVLQEQSIRPDVLNKTIVFYVMFLLMPMALFSVYKTLQGASFDGSSDVLMERIKGMAINVNGNGYVNEFRNVLPTIVLMFYVATRRSVLAVFLLLLFVFYRMYVGHGRFNIVMLFFGLVMIEYYVFGRKVLTPKMLFYGISVAIIFYLLGENRHLIKSIFTGESVVAENVVEKKFLEGMDFANFEYLTYILAVIPSKSETYHYGLQYLQLFTEPIPRILWSGKPVGPPIEFYNLMDFGNWLGLTQSTVGDAWQNGGVVGLFITMSLWGAGLSLLFRRFMRGSDFSKFVWIVIVPYFLQMFRDGGVVTIFKFMLFSTFPFIIYLFFVSRSGRSEYETR